MAPSFKIEPHNYVDKHFYIEGPEFLDLYVDYDDVYHEAADVLAEEMVKILNLHWKSVPVLQCRNDSCAESYNYLYEEGKRSTCMACHTPLTLILIG